MTPPSHRHCMGARRCSIDPQEPELRIEKPAVRDKQRLVAGDAGQAAARPPFPTILSPALSADMGSALQGNLAAVLGRGVVSGLWFTVVIFFSSKLIHLPASWNREHDLCRKSSFVEKSPSSQLVLTLLSEMVLLLLRVTPKIAT